MARSILTLLLLLCAAQPCRAQGHAELRFRARAGPAVRAGSSDLVAVDATCPVCGAKVTLRIVTASDAVAEQDRDFCEQREGQQPVLVLPQTCPRCLFSGYPEDFSKTVSAEAKRQILEQHAIKAPDDIAKPWVRQDLIAQRMLLEGADTAALGEQYLRAAWSVRLEPAPFNEQIQTLRPEEREWFRQQLLAGTFGVRPQKDQGRMAIEIAGAVATQLSLLPAEKGRAAAVLSAQMLRMHGENERLLALLPVLRPSWSASGGNFDERISQSIGREREYQQRALAAFTAALTKPPDSLADDRRAMLTYLCGELSRRLGRDTAASEWYRKAAGVPGGTDWLKQWSTEQLQLLK